jgi:hypothetical protein
MNASQPLLFHALSRAVTDNGSLAVQTRHTLQRYLQAYISETIRFEDCVMMLQSIVPNLSFLAEVQIILATDAYRDTAPPGFRHWNHQRWERDEDHRLLAAIHRYGATDWVAIASFVGRGRTRAQCAQRWQRSLNPMLRHQRWHPGEDARLVRAVTRHGEHAWNRVAADLKSRCDLQCKGRWKTIMGSGGGRQPPPSLFSASEQTDDIYVFDVDIESDELGDFPEPWNAPIPVVPSDCVGHDDRPHMVLP